MLARTRSASLTLVSCLMLAACGGRDAGTDSGAPDVVDDHAAPEASADIVVVDGGFDVTSDVAADVNADTRADTAVDVAIDRAVDSAPDAPADVAAESSLDDVFDAAPDDVVDVTVDNGPVCAGEVCSGNCVDLATDVNHCGDCATVCPVPSDGSATCAAGSCGIACDPGFVPSAGACVAIAAPRPLAPMSGSTVSSRQPTLRWLLAAGTDGARVEICRDRACTTVIATVDAPGSSARPPADLPAGVIFWRLRGHGNASVGISVSPTWEFTVGSRSAPVDRAWGSTLDVNGDGFADLVAGAYESNNRAGRVHLFYGGSAGIPTSATLTLDGPDGAGGGFGVAVSSAGDIDGDGYLDLVVGAYNVDNHTGRAYVYRGSDAGVIASPAAALVGPDGMLGYFGGSVWSAGDVNGDGYGDVLVGAFNVDGTTGAAYLYLGSALGLATTPAIRLAGPAGANASFGGTGVSAGDVNGDGFDDVLISASGALSRTGQVYLYLGNATGLASAPALAITGPDGSPGFFGQTVNAAGDLDGDGYVDLVVGAESVNNMTGRAYVFPGNVSGFASVPSIALDAPAGSGSGFGHTVSAAGDVNADGYADLVVTAPYVGTQTGQAYVFPGSALGIATTPTTTLTGPDGSGEYFGNPAIVAGDVNGDGFADIASSAAHWNVGTGRTYLYLGGSSGIAVIPATILVGPDGPNSYFGYPVATRGLRVRPLHAPAVGGATRPTAQTGSKSPV